MMNCGMGTILIVVPLSLSACGQMPIPERKVIATYQEAKVLPLVAPGLEPMDVAAPVKDSVGPVVGLIPLSGNMSTNESAATVPELLDDAIDDLRKGDTEKAKKRLARILLMAPDNHSASDLLRQITSEPQEYFPVPGAFPYTLGPSDSLITVADRFLGDPMKFHILARYNGLSSAVQVYAGQTIRVPGNQSDSSSLAVAPPSRYDQAKLRYEQGDTSGALKILESQLSNTPGDGTARKLLRRIFLEKIGSELDKANFDGAEQLADRALNALPSDKRILQKKVEMGKKRKVMELYQSARTSLQADDKLEAFSRLQQVLELQPDYQPALQILNTLNADVVEIFHREAMQSYRRQQLDQAISYWDRLLNIAPNHEQAMLYRDRAQQLKQQLNQLQ